MVFSDHRMNCEELDQGRGQVEEGGAVLGKGGEEHPGLEHGQGHQLAAEPEHVGHRDVHGEDVEHREDTNSDLLRGHELHDGVVQLGHVGHQVPVGQFDSFRDPGGAGTVRQDRDIIRRD